MQTPSDIRNLAEILPNCRSEAPALFEAAEALRALLDRAEKAEDMLAAKSKVNHELIRGQAEMLAANYRLKAERDAALARPSAPETLAWAVVGEDGKLPVGSVTPFQSVAENYAESSGGSFVRVAIRRVED